MPSEEDQVDIPSGQLCRASALRAASQTRHNKRWLKSDDNNSQIPDTTARPLTAPEAAPAAFNPAMRLRSHPMSSKDLIMLAIVSFDLLKFLTGLLTNRANTLPWSTVTLT